MAGRTRRVVIAGGLALAGAGAFGAMLPRGARSNRPTHTLPLVGVNLASAEFGSNVPGRHGHDYVYPDASEVQYFADLGFNCLRLPFLWERLQPELDAAFDAAERARLEQLVAAMTARGMTAVIDPHNYARRRTAADKWSREHLIGSAAVPTRAFLDFWRRLTGLFKDNPRVTFGLMNEPYDMAATQWLEIANATIAAIRSVGARNLILVPGTAWSGAHSWIASGNAVLERISDPLANFAIEVHQYFDDNSSGTSPDVVSGVVVPSGCRPSNPGHASAA